MYSIPVIPTQSTENEGWVSRVKSQSSTPCKGKSVNYQCFCPCRAFCFYQSVHPGRCHGLWAYWAFSPYNWLLNLPSYYFFLLNPYNRHLTHPWLCVYWAFSPLCLCLDTTSFRYFSTSTETQFQLRYLHFWPLKTACWTSKTTFGAKFLSFARAAQILLIYRRIRWFVPRMCNRRNAKRTTFRSKTTPFAAQKGSFCNAKEA